MRHSSMFAGLTIALLPFTLQAQGVQNHLYDKLQLSGSGTLVIYNTTLRIDPDSGSGTTINGENVLGLSKTNLQPRVAGRLRLGRRNELELGFQWASRSSEAVLMDSLVIGDTTFAAGLRVAAHLNTSQAFLTYRFAFMAHDRTQIGIGIGLGAILLRESIDALAGTTAGGPDTTIVQFSQGESFTGPTASVGLYGRFRVGDRWYIDAEARGVYLKISNISASVFEGGGAVKYFFSNTVGAELGYGIGAYAVTLSREGELISFSGKVKYTAQGIRAGIIIVL